MATGNHSGDRQSRLLVMSPLAVKSLAFEWFLKGFEQSGYSFHGEVATAGSKMARRLIGREFDRQWAQRRKRTLK